MSYENKTKSKQQRKEEREIIAEYHKVVTEESLELLYELFLKWKQGTLPYDELTEHIHLFHKKNQEIYKEFNYTKRDALVLYAKMKLGLLSKTDITQHQGLLQIWEQDETDGELD